MRRQRCLDQRQESIEPTQIKCTLIILPCRHWAKECANTIRKIDSLYLYSVKLLPSGVHWLLGINVLSSTGSSLVISIQTRIGYLDSIDQVINPTKNVIWYCIKTRNKCGVTLVVMVPPILLAEPLDCWCRTKRIALTFSKGCSDMLMSSTLTQGKRVGVLSYLNLLVILWDHSTWEYVVPVLSNRYPVSLW